jgi:hypothetical protein
MSNGSADNRDLDDKAIDALMAAQNIPPGPEQTEALRHADRLHRAADTYKHIFSNELNPPGKE